MDSLLKQIEDRFRMDQLSKDIARNFGDIPISYEKISPEWLTAILSAEHPGAKVKSFRLGPVDDGVSNRRRIFIDYHADGLDTANPRSVFCKSSQGLQNRVLAALWGTAYGEVTFYNQLRPNFPAEAAKCYFARFDPESFNSIIVLEDMTEIATLCTDEGVTDFAQALAMVETLAKFHGHFYEHQDLGTAEINLPTWPQYFTTLLGHSLEEACGNGFAAAAAVIPPSLFARASEIWPCTIASVEQHRSLPRTLLQGDSHLKNWYRRPDGSMGLLDWQAACIGHWSRDYIYAMTIALDVQTRRKWERPLLEHYLAKLQEYGGPKTSLDDALLWCRQQLFAVLAFWTVTLRPPGSSPDLQPASTSLKYIERITNAMVDWASLASFG